MNSLQFSILTRSFYHFPHIYKQYTEEIKQKFDTKNKKLYSAPVFAQYVRHNTKANEKAFEAVYDFLKRGGFGDWKRVFEDAYNSVKPSAELKRTLKKATMIYYNYRKKRGAINYKKADVTYNLNIKDQKTINILSASDILWIKNHATRTNVSTAMQKIITDGLNNYLSADAIANSLTGMIEGLKGNAYIELFGEQKYWEMVTNTNMTRISSFSDLNTFQEAEITEYYIDTRGALACDICAPYSNKVYTVSGAVNKMNTYLKYAENEDIESMTSIYTFGSANVNGIGETPPFHPNCYCELLPVI